MPTVEQFMGLGQPKLKLGQGFRGRLPGGGGPAPLRPPPGIPHIQAPKAPPINYGAVAQVGRQPRPQLQAPRQFDPLQAITRTAFPKGLPSTAMPKLSKVEQQAMNAIHQSYNSQYKDPGRKANQLIFNPTPKMVQHLNNTPNGPLMHKMAIQDAQAAPSSAPAWGKGFAQAINHPYAGMTYGQKVVAQIDAQVQRQKDAQTQAAGFGYLPIPHAVSGYLQNAGTDISNTLQGVGPGMAAAGEAGYKGMSNVDYAIAHNLGLPTHNMPRYASQTPVFENMLKQTAQSYKDMFTTNMWYTHPFQFWMNVGTVASGVAGGAARLGKVGELANAVKTGELTPLQATHELMKTPQFERKVSVVPGGGVIARPPAFRSTLGGWLQSQVLDPLTEKAIESRRARPPSPLQLQIKGRSLNVTPDLKNLAARLAEGHNAKFLRRDSEMRTEILRGEAEQKLLAKARPEAVHPDTGVPLSEHRLPTPAGIANDPWMNNFSFFHNTKTGKTIFSGVGEEHADITGLEDAGAIPHPKGSRLAEEKGLVGKLEAARRVKGPYHGMQTPLPDSAIAKADGWVGGTGIFDPATGEPAAANFNFQHPDAPKWSKQVLENAKKNYWKERPEPLGLTKDQRAKIQQQAYQIGAMQNHHIVHKDLYEGGAGAADSIFQDPNGYVGIKPPVEGPFGLKESEKFNTQRNIARQRQSIVEHDPEKLLADPEKYSYIPKAVWNKLKLDSPEAGTASKFLNGIDMLNQGVRVGRFLHPGYAAWAVQNGILHLSQAGAHVFRNVYQLRNEYSRLSDADLAMADNSVGAGHFGGGIARATQGGEESVWKSGTKAMARFWHNIDDKVPRRLALIHELNRAGYHSAEDWSNLMHTDPAKFRRIALTAQKHAIDYAEMSPAERATLAKVMTAYGWTRGASTYAMRFPFEHPVQATILNRLGQEGQQRVNDFYSGYNGMVPSWLKGYLPLGHGNHPSMLATSDINPGETLGSLIQSMPWLYKGPHDPLITQLGPAAAALAEGITGRDPYGKAIPNAQQISKPFSDMLRRANPVSVFGTFTRSKQGGGTFTQGIGPGLESFFGVPLSRLVNPTQTSALGMKDMETSLSRPDAITFEYNHALQQIPRIQALWHQKTGQALSPGDIAAYKGDLAAVEQQKLWQAKYAASKGANSFTTLPATNRADAGIQFLLQHKYIDQATAMSLQDKLKQFHTEAEMNTAATRIWNAHKVGEIVKRWDSVVKKLQPAQLQAPRG